MSTTHTRFVKALHEMGVDVVVAPYEADAQLTYLNKISVAQIVITEDSDLVLFGCEKVKKLKMSLLNQRYGQVFSLLPDLVQAGHQRKWSTDRKRKDHFHHSVRFSEQL